MKSRYYISVDPGVATGVSVVRAHEGHLRVVNQAVLSLDAVHNGALHRCFQSWMSRYPITRVVVEEFTLIRKVRKTEKQRIAWEHAHSTQVEVMALASLYKVRMFLVKPDRTGYITTHCRSSIGRCLEGALERYSRHIVDTVVFVMKVEGLVRPFWLNTLVSEESDEEIITWEESLSNTPNRAQTLPVARTVMIPSLEQNEMLRAIAAGAFYDTIYDSSFTGQLEIVSD